MIFILTIVSFRLIKTIINVVFIKCMFARIIFLLYNINV